MAGEGSGRDKKAPDVYLYSRGAQLKMDRRQEKRQLQKLRRRGDPRYNRGTARA